MRVDPSVPSRGPIIRTHANDYTESALVGGSQKNPRIKQSTTTGNLRCSGKVRLYILVRRPTYRGYLGQYAIGYATRLVGMRWAGGETDFNPPAFFYSADQKWRSMDHGIAPIWVGTMSPRVRKWIPSKSPRPNLNFSISKKAPEQGNGDQDQSLECIDFAQ